ncbi:thiamine kinase [Pectobacterium brasiliense]|uniref:thiamine kinase n=1 Tax=Pectobacterium brasiliense TaxID=180957 RepID=UPI0001A44D49|nr:thiamine kinase [Pectobacterium brasiliense]KGA23749.1 thiamine kinase [Pectobacterium brasiliense]KRF66167.1 thiamine kinase [Pectobacterium brasiliense]MBN3185386.1 thiamine kinase [Pectobacterium brasiliense]QHG30153.1 thiamine kinase [Pectobacterium brasiliense]
MAPFSIKQAGIQQQLTATIQKHFPAVEMADIRFELVGGLSSKSWRIRGPDIEWLARRQSSTERKMGVDRQREFALLRQMSAIGLAPRPRLWRDGWLIVEWVPGRIATSDEFLMMLANGEVTRLLSQLHRQPRCGHPLDLKVLFAQHWQLMDPRRRSPTLLRAHHYFQRAVLPTPLALAPLHLDVHAENLLITPQETMLIDWEYASDGDIAFELAFIVRASQMESMAQTHFLQSYQRHRRGFSVSRLQQQMMQWFPWVDYLVLMWFEVRWQQTKNPEFLAEIPALYHRLQQYHWL